MRFVTSLTVWHVVGLGGIVLVVIGVLFAVLHPQPVTIAPLNPSLAEKCRTEGCTLEEKFRSGDIQLCAEGEDRRESINCAAVMVREKALAAGVSYCGYLPSEVEKRQCEAEYFFSSALASGSAEPCKEIGDEAMRTRCEQFFVPVDAENSEK